jgi:hypothetical protein
MSIVVCFVRVKLNWKWIEAKANIILIWWAKTKRTKYRHYSFPSNWTILLKSQSILTYCVGAVVLFSNLVQQPYLYHYSHLYIDSYILCWGSCAFLKPSSTTLSVLLFSSLYRFLHIVLGQLCFSQT